MALENLFGKDLNLEKLPAELRPLVEQMRQERAAYEALLERAEPLVPAVAQLEQRLKGVDQLAAQLAQLPRGPAALQQGQQATQARLVETTTMVEAACGGATPAAAQGSARRQTRAVHGQRVGRVRVPESVHAGEPEGDGGACHPTGRAVDRDHGQGGSAASGAAREHPVPGPAREGRGRDQEAPRGGPRASRRAGPTAGSLALQTMQAEAAINTLREATEAAKKRKP